MVFRFSSKRRKSRKKSSSLYPHTNAHIFKRIYRKYFILHVTVCAEGCRKSCSSQTILACIVSAPMLLFFLLMERSGLRLTPAKNVRTQTVFTYRYPGLEMVANQWQIFCVIVTFVVGIQRSPGTNTLEFPPIFL